jgi:MarR family transcriptional regulator, 2-MHQ and catechol-resistance regulon repressor
MGTHHQGAQEEVRALNVYIKLMRAANTIQSLVERRLNTLGLTENQFGSMEILYYLGPQSQRDLGSKLFTSGGNITMVIDNLEKRSLVERVRSETDRRTIIVSLTEQGRQLIAEIMPGQIDSIVELFAPLDAEEQETLSALCKKLGLANRPER